MVRRTLFCEAVVEEWQVLAGQLGVAWPASCAFCGRTLYRPPKLGRQFCYEECGDRSR
jgi:hypothetical protein